MESLMKFWSASFIVQLAGRLLSFISNQFLVRLLTPAHFGIWSVRLALIMETIVFWAREGVRKAAARDKKNPHGYAILPLLIGVAISPVVLFISAKSSSEDGFMTASVLTTIGSLLELTSEMWAVPQLAAMNGGPLAKMCSLAFLFRSLTVVTLVKVFYQQDAPTNTLMLCYGTANCLFGVILVIGFLIKCGKPVLAKPTLKELSSLRPFAFQTILQWFFAQGERMILLVSNTPEQVGVFGFVSDISSLAARIIFAPVESAVFQVCATSEDPPISIVSIASRCVCYIGLCAAAFGPPIVPPILTRVYGDKWSSDDAKSTFAAVCRVMPMMTLNGVTEAYANARLPSKKLSNYNLMLSGVSVIYFALMYYLSQRYGACGAVYANGVNMALRSVMAVRVIFKECGSKWCVLPDFRLIAVFAVIACFGARIRLMALIAMIPVVAGIVLFMERNTLKELLNLRSHKKV